VSAELEPLVRNIFQSLKRKDVDAVMRVMDDGVQGVDEISQRWLRGRDELADYLGALMTRVENVETELLDVQESVSGDMGVLTCWLEQDYTLEGNRQHVSAPTTVVFRRRQDGWRMALFHSIPLPES
jgi:ketosteroid isomerase-like protein